MYIDRDSFIINPSSPQMKFVRRRIRRQVIMEYLPELEKATGWRRYLVKWKVNLIIEIRFRGILFMGASVSQMG